MQIKYLTYMKNLKTSFAIFILAISCSSRHVKHQDDPVFTTADSYDFNKKMNVRCTPNSKVITYELGDTPCWRDKLKVNEKEKLAIKLIITNKNAEDPYEYGYKELQRYLNGKVVEKIKLRRDGEPVWSFAPFVRIRKQTYLADLDNDGYLEFAVFPFSPGSAIWGTVRIFSLKEKVEFWGEGRYQFEGDTFVQLGCMRCSKFNPEECKKCY